MKRKCFFTAMFGAALTFGILFGACKMDGGSDPVPVADDPANGTMSEATAQKVFAYSPVEGGLSIDKFKDAVALRDYLSGSARALADSGVFKISKIGDAAVVQIGAGAFSPSRGAASLAEAGVSTVSLPETIAAIGEGAFSGAAAAGGGKLKLNIPPSVMEKLPADVKAELEEAGAGGEEEKEKESVSGAKSVSITNLDPAYDAKWLVLYLATDSNNPVAGGVARISGGGASVPLKTLNGYSVTQNDWTGSGSFIGYCLIFETENDTADTSKRIVTGDINALTISDQVTVVNAAEKLIFEYPFDDPRANAVYNQLYLKIGATVNGGAIPAGYRVLVQVYLDEACRNPKTGSGGHINGPTPAVVDYKTVAYPKIQRVYFGVRLGQIDPDESIGETITVKTTPIPGKYLDLAPGAGTYGSPADPIDLGTVDVTYDATSPLVPPGSRSISIGAAPDCVIKVTGTESAIDYSHYNSVNTMTSITSAPEGSTIYVAILPQNPAVHLIRLNPLTVTGVSSGDIAYHKRFTDTYGPIFGAVYRLTVPAQDITVSAPGAAVAPVTVTGTVSLTLDGGVSLAPTENGGLSIDLSTAGFENQSLAGTHVDNVLGNGNVPWSITCIPDLTYTVQARIRKSDNTWLSKDLSPITLDSGGNVASGSTALHAVFP
jgi:hypothetical protein